MEQEQSLPNKAQPKKKQQQPVVTPPVEAKVEPQVDTQATPKDETKKVVKVDNMTITYN